MVPEFERVRDAPAAGLRRALVGALCVVYFPAVCLGGLLLPVALYARLGVAFDAAIRYSLVALLAAYLGGLAALARP